MSPENTERTFLKNLLAKLVEVESSSCPEWCLRHKQGTGY